jgi:hypothetical protein
MTSTALQHQQPIRRASFDDMPHDIRTHYSPMDLRGIEIADTEITFVERDALRNENRIVYQLRNGTWQFVSSKRVYEYRG